MNNKEERLRERFSEFRTPTQSASEKAFIETAIIIANYVENVSSVAAIKTDFSSGTSSKTYNGFEEPHKKRTMGALLFGKLALDDYIKNNLADGSSEERSLLTELSGIVGGLYSDPKNNKDQIDNLFKKASEWIENHAATTAHKEEAKKLCNSLYTMLSCLNIKIDNLSFIERSLGGDLVTKAKTQIGNLLTATETKVKQLEEQLAQKASEAQDVPVKTLHDHCNDRFLAILNHKDNDETTKLEELERTSSELSTDINLLIAKQQEQLELEKDIKMIDELLKATSKNDTSVTGRKYFLQLVADNKPQFDRLLNRLEEPQKSKFQKDMAPIQTPSTSNTVTSGALYAMSWLTSPLSVVTRAVTPQFIQDNLNALMPATQDSLCKGELKSLAISTLSNLKEKLKTTKSEVSDLQDKIAAGNGELKTLLQKADQSSLQEVVTANTATMEVVHKYLEVIEPIKKTGEKLSQMQSLDKNIDSFIQANDHWYSKVGDFFSRMKSLWKTESLSDKLEHAKQCKSELSGLQKTYQQDLAQKMHEFNANPEISDPIKDKLNRQLTAHSQSSGSTSIAESTQAEFKSIRSQMKALRSEVQEPGPEAGDNLSRPEAEQASSVQANHL